MGLGSDAAFQVLSGIAESWLSARTYYGKTHIAVDSAGMTVVGVRRGWAAGIRRERGFAGLRGSWKRLAGFVALVPECAESAAGIPLAGR